MPSGSTAESREPLGGALPRALVLGDDHLLSGGPVLTDDVDLHRGDLTLEAALLDRPGGLALALEPQPVDVLTGDAPVLGDPLGGTELVGEVPGNSSGREEPGPLNTLAPRPTRLIASTPHPMPTSMASAAIRLLTKLLACCPEPHWQSTVVAAGS